MGDEHRDTGTGWPEQQPATGPPPAAPVDDGTADDAAAAAAAPAGGAAEPEAAGGAAEPDIAADGDPSERREAAAGTETTAGRPARRFFGWAMPRGLGPAGIGIAVLLALLGFSLAVQVRSTTSDALAGARQEDLVRILSDLEAQEQRLNQEIARLEERQRQLASGAEGRQAALEEATRRADELGILAGTLPARGPGLSVRFAEATKPITASALLNAMQELRGAGAEAMQIAGGDGRAVRVVASTYFLDDAEGIDVAGQRLTAPYTITVIGDPATMRTALNIPDGVVESVDAAGGTVTIQDLEVAEVTALRRPADLQFAHPVS
jgi:uncharacterized protein YlxW (UPF0749 family)